MMCVNHPYNLLPYLIFKVYRNDAGVHAQTNEKPKGIRCGTIPISKGLGLRVKTALSGVSRLLRAVPTVVSYIERYMTRRFSRLTFYMIKKG